MKVGVLIVFLSCFFISIAQNLTDAKGRKQGPWSKKYPNSIVYQYKGQFKDNKPVGTFTYYYYPSNKVKAVIKHDELSNRSEAFYYHEEGTLLSHGIFRNMKKDSIWLNFGPSGNLSTSETYKDDQLNGKKTIFYVPEVAGDKSRIVATTCYYVNNKLNGQWTEYFNDGKIKAKGNYVLDKKNGVWETYHTTGKVMTAERYKNGVLHGWSYGYDQGGKEIGKKYYYNGKQLKGKQLELKLNELKIKGIDPNF